MNSIKIVLALAAAILLSPGPATAGDEPGPASQSDLIRIIRLSGADRPLRDMAGQLSDRFFEYLKTANPDAPARAHMVMNEEFSRQADRTEDYFLETLAAEYGKHLNEDEVDFLLDVYKNPVMKKFVSLDSKLSRASNKVAQNWGVRIAKVAWPKITERIDEEFKGQAGSTADHQAAVEQDPAAVEELPATEPAVQESAAKEIDIQIPLQATDESASPATAQEEVEQPYVEELPEEALEKMAREKAETETVPGG